MLMIKLVDDDRTRCCPTLSWEDHIDKFVSRLDPISGPGFLTWNSEFDPWSYRNRALSR